MKGLMIFRNHTTEWITKFFPGTEPLLIPIVNKPLIGYLLELFIMMGIKKLRLVTEGSAGAVEKWFMASNNKYKSKIDVSFNLIRSEDTIETAFVKNKSFWYGTEPVYYTYGYGFMFYNQTKSDDFKAMFCQTAKTEATKDFFWGVLKPPRFVLPKKIMPSKKQRYFSQLYATKKISSIPIKNCKDYYSLSMRILNDFPTYFGLTPPAATAHARNDKLLMGEKTILKKNTILKENFFIGANAVIQADCIIGKGAILSDEVVVDEGTQVVDSIILPKTYLGKWLSIRDAIVYNKTLIHIPSGHVVDFEDEHIAGSVWQKNKLGFIRYLWEVPLALILLLVQTPVYWYYLAFATDYYSIYRKRVLCYLNKRFEISERWSYTFERGSVGKWIFMQFFLDKRELLKDVLSGKLRLVGNCPLEATTHNKQTIRMMDSYEPGVFWFSEMTDPVIDEDEQFVINELYFSNHKMPFKYLRTITKIFLRRFLKWA
ncbi:hypothetical protein COTS27_01487 [Spirochaetota bacterium]|nr:hypothetical protein COTS27_01487 [Spirochaetota bacterium]